MQTITESLLIMLVNSNNLSLWSTRLEQNNVAGTWQQDPETIDSDPESSRVDKTIDIDASEKSH